MNREEKIQELEKLSARILELESELEGDGQTGNQWTTGKYYTTFHFLSGMMLGFFGAIASLLFNVVGSVLVKQHPLELIRVFLTFPLGENALSISAGAVLALGCCLYLATGMVYGAFFHIVLSRFFNNDSFLKRFGVATIMGVLIWVINFYGILSWLQPKLFGGSWILDMIPVWVALLTHLSFAWAMLLIDSWGHFDSESHNQQAA